MTRTLRMIARGGSLAVRSRRSIAWLIEEVGGQQGSNIQWRGRSNTASAPSEIPNHQGSRKKVSKDQRRAMLEVYVKEYREANAGMFPTASKAKKEVGGNFYFIRNIIQELEYYFKMDQLTSGSKTPTRNESRNNRKSVSEIRDSPSQVTDDTVNDIVVEVISLRGANLATNHNDETAASDKFLRSSVLQINPDLAGQQSTTDRKDDRGIPCQPERHEDACKEVFDHLPKLESHQTCVTEESKGDVSPRGSYDDTEEVDLATSKVLKGQTGLDSPQRLEKPHEASDSSVEKQEVAEPPRTSSLWGNLKSFADGIISIWRNR